MSVVDEVKSRLDIVDIVSSYVPSLKKAGRTYKGNCPFHNEKTPSFVVFPETQSWHCFGACGTGGDAFGFVMRQEGLEFREALEMLANKAGVALEPQTPQTIEADQKHKKLLEMMAASSAYFHAQLLKSPAGQFTRDYLLNRGLTAETVNQFQIGYAPDQWEALKNHLLEKGYTEADLLAGGLLVERDDGSPGYDRFRNRLMIPIRDTRGRVIGFGARALKDDQVPKYLNSPQSALFDKGTILYGLDLARSAIRDAGRVVIVEGYLDVLQAHQQGFKNVVAQMGTALTEDQLKLLKRQTETFILALDADKAGGAATMRGINTAREVLDEVVPVPTARGLIRYESRLSVDMRVAILPQGKDPDDLLREDKQAWQQLLDEALPLVDYFIRQTAAELNLDDIKGRTKAVQEILPVIREIKNAVEQDHYLRQLASLVKIDERTLRQELQRTSPSQSNTKRNVTVKPIARPTKEPTPNRSVSANKGPLEEYCLALLINNPRVLAIVNQKLQDNQVQPILVTDFIKTENKALFDCMKTWLSENPNGELDYLLQMIEPHLEGHLASILALWHEQPTALEMYIEKQLIDMIIRLRLDRLKLRRDELREMISNAFQIKDKAAVTEYTASISQMTLQLDKLNKAKDALSIMGQRRMEERF
ncbi:MAG: DNA primase [Chloroflexota bacterium]